MRCDCASPTVARNCWGFYGSRVVRCFTGSRVVKNLIVKRFSSNVLDKNTRSHCSSHREYDYSTDGSCNRWERGAHRNALCRGILQRAELSGGSMKNAWLQPCLIASNRFFQGHNPFLPPGPDCLLDVVAATSTTGVYVMKRSLYLFILLQHWCVCRWKGLVIGCRHWTARSWVGVLRAGWRERHSGESFIGHSSIWSQSIAINGYGTIFGWFNWIFGRRYWMWAKSCSFVQESAASGHARTILLLPVFPSRRKKTSSTTWWKRCVIVCVFGACLRTCVCDPLVYNSDQL